MAKAKRLNTTVHVGDSETGETRVLGPNDKLSAADRKELEKRWGKNADQFLEDTDDEEPEDKSVEEHMDEGHPPPSGMAAEPASNRVEEAMKLGEETKTAENPQKGKPGSK